MVDRKAWILSRLLSQKCLQASRQLLYVVELLRIIIPLQTEPHTAQVNVFIFVLVRASSRFPQSLQKTRDPIAVILKSTMRSQALGEKKVVVSQ
jgi:hypothetical protein